MMKARGLMDEDVARMYLLDRNLLAKGEWEKMVEGDRHSTVFFWIQRAVVVLKENGNVLLNSYSFQQMAYDMF